MPSPADVYISTIELAKELISRPSIVSDDAGCLELIAKRLAESGFSYERMDRGKPHNLVRNLWARHGTNPPILCLAGHVDVLPPVSAEKWTNSPWVPTERGGYLFGRGAADGKTAVAAMVTAVERVVADMPDHRGSIAIALTSDKDGGVNDGTLAIVKQMLWRGERIDACILGEPTALASVGDNMKNGRRGLMRGALTVKGVASPIDHPEAGKNPIHDALPALTELAAIGWDEGNEYLAPTNLQISSIHAVPEANTLPGALEIQFTFRYSTASNVDVLRTRINDVLTRHGLATDVSWALVRNAYCTPRGRLTEAITAAAAAVAGVTPAFSTAGGISDGALFAMVASEVVECGPVGVSPQVVDECVRLSDIAPLSRIYEQAIRNLLG